MDRIEKHPMAKNPWQELTKRTKNALEEMRSGESFFARIVQTSKQGTAAETRAGLQALLDEKARRESVRKWTGRGLMVLGVVTMLGSCPLSLFSLVGQSAVPLAAILVSLALIASGVALTAIRPRLQDTNEALLAAMKYDYRLTAARLALEMDVSLPRAEKIIQELVRSGIAEIDLDHGGSDHTLTYKVKGF